MARMWVWTMIGVDLILLIPGFIMVSDALEVAGANSRSMAALGIAALFLALPVFCVAAPYSAWRIQSRGDDSSALAIAAMPVIYAVFLTVVIFWQ